MSSKFENKCKEILTEGHFGLTGKSYPIVVQNKKEGDKLVKLLEPFIAKDTSAKTENEIKNYNLFYKGKGSWKFVIPNDIVIQLEKKKEIELVPYLDYGNPAYALR